MKTLDRTTPPAWGQIKLPTLPAYTQKRLDNGAQLIVLRGGEQPLVKVDVVCRAGSLRADKALVAKAAMTLLNEGTTTLTSKQIAEKLEFYGAYTWGTPAAQTTTISALCLQKDVAPVMELFADIMKNPIFPDEELEIFKNYEAQKFAVNQLKTSFVSSMLMLETVYEAGSRHGRHTSAEAIAALQREDLLRFHRQTYTPTDAIIFVSGLPTQHDVEMIERAFGSEWTAGETWMPQAPNYQHPQQVRHAMESEQTSLVLARPTFDNHHADRYVFNVLDTVLGGYIGSRLMQNLREKRGLTYGVQSNNVVNSLGGLHQIRTEIRSGQHDEAITEIFKEFEALAAVGISDVELQNVRSYLLGEIVRLFESPMASADTVLGLVADGFGLDSIEQYFDTVQNVDAGALQRMAQKWLRPEEYTTIVVGKL